MFINSAYDKKKFNTLMINKLLSYYDTYGCFYNAIVYFDNNFPDGTNNKNGVTTTQDYKYWYDLYINKENTLAENKANDKGLTDNFEIESIVQVGYPDYLKYELGDDGVLLFEERGEVEFDGAEFHPVFSGVLFCEDVVL